MLSLDMKLEIIVFLSHKSDFIPVNGFTNHIDKLGPCSQARQTSTPYIC